METALERPILSTIVGTPPPVKKPRGAPRFSISVLCYNFEYAHHKVTIKCLESIIKNSGQDYELFITDNASPYPGTRKYLEEFQSRHSDRVKLIRNVNNMGFQDPNKHALTLARGEFFVLLNNDMETCPEWLEHLAAPFAENHRMGITGAGPGCTRLSNDFKAMGGEPVEYIEGSCLMIPTALARKEGLFPDYLKFIYWEDTALSFRIRELGYEIQTVLIPMKHRHPSTTTKLMDLREVKQHNADQFKKRWHFYIKRRNFERRVLIRRLGARGDVLLLTPALRALRNKYPLAEIQIKTHDDCAMMLKGMDGVKLATKKVSYFDEFYDLDLAYEARPNVHIVQAYADKLEVKLPAQWKIEMFPTESDMVWGFNKSRGTKVALIHAGMTTWPGKNWPLDRMAEVVKFLKAHGYFTIAVGAADSPRVGCDDSVAGLSTPQQVYALAKHASMFVGLDSMPQHIMSAANVPSVVMFGPTNPRMIVRPSPRIIAVQATTDDAPCVGAHGRRTTPVTQAPCDGACSAAVSVEMMTRAIKRLIAITT